MVAPGCTTSPVPSLTSIICRSVTLWTGVKLASLVPSSLLVGFMPISLAVLTASFAIMKHEIYEQDYMTEQIRNYLRRNLYIFYSSQILNGLRFIAPVWVLFFTHYISFEQLALLEALGLIISVALELPTGVLADLIGRKA